MDFLGISVRLASGSLSERPDYGTGDAAVPRDDSVAQSEHQGFIKHVKGKGYCVKSPKNPDWSGGCYPTKAEAEKRLSQVEAFKHMNASDLLRIATKIAGI